MSDEKTEFPREAIPSGSGSMQGYSVEARHNYPDPLTVGDQIFDIRWKPVRYDKGHCGVPTRSGTPHDAGTYGVYDFAAAQALRWWLHAAAAVSKDFSGLCLETRLICHKIKFEYSVEAIEAFEHVGGDDGDISSRRPVLNKTE